MSGLDKNLTPYQGPRRGYGVLKCPKCGETWGSGNTWANMGQKCAKCHTSVYPHIQAPLKGQEKDGDKPHLETHCEKFQKLKRNCKTGKPLSPGSFF